MQKLYDDVIVGSGVSGLFIARMLLEKGRRVLLLEKNSIASGQSVVSQGILHSGLKYLFYKKTSVDVDSMSSSMALWDNYFSGLSIDLSNVKKRSSHCLVWNNSNFLIAPMLETCASGLFKSQCEKISKSSPILDHINFSGSPFLVKEIILDPRSLIEELVRPIMSNVIVFDDDLNFLKTNDNNISAVQFSLEGVRQSVSANNFIFCAGAGNEHYLEEITMQSYRMQNRPLLMSYAKGKLPIINGHFISEKGVLVTITSSVESDYSVVWQIGGMIAEECAGDKNLIINTLKKITRNIDFSSVDIGFYSAVRAEGFFGDGKIKPSYEIYRFGNSIFCWPMKLVLAPAMANYIASIIDAKIESSAHIEKYPWN